MAEGGWAHDLRMSATRVSRFRNLLAAAGATARCMRAHHLLTTPSGVVPLEYGTSVRAGRAGDDNDPDERRKIRQLRHVAQSQTTTHAVRGHWHSYAWRLTENTS